MAEEQPQLQPQPQQQPEALGSAGEAAPTATEPSAPSAAESMTLPLELIDQCIGKRIRAFLRDQHVVDGKLVGFDDLVNLVLDDVEEVGNTAQSLPTKRMLLSSRSLTMIAPLE